MHDLMAGIIYEAGAIWPELVSMRTLAARMQREARGISLTEATEAARIAGARGAEREHRADLHHEEPDHEADDPDDLHVRPAGRPQPG